MSQVDLSPARLAEMRAAAEKATAPGEWASIEDLYANAEHIANFSPANAIALLDALTAERARVEALTEALTAAAGELFEAEDKFWVIHRNHPGEAAGRAQGEDKMLCAELANRMRAAKQAARKSLARQAIGEKL